jgi:hypothetical protein
MRTWCNIEGSRTNYLGERGVVGEGEHSQPRKVYCALMVWTMPLPMLACMKHHLATFSPHRTSSLSRYSTEEDRVSPKRKIVHLTLGGSEVASATASM